MAGFCLLPQAVDKFRTGLKDGTIDPAKLAHMTSEERNKFFEQFVGKPNSKDVNALFEGKLLLKNQQAGMVSWAKKVAGLKPEVRRDILSRIERIDKVLDPEDKQQFLKELASSKLGVGVTQDEAKTIATLSKKVVSTREAMDAGGNRLEWGRAKIALSNYVNDLKLAANKTDLKQLSQHPFQIVEKTANFLKSIRATLDDSAVFHQGWKAIFTDPKEWGRNALESFSNAAKEFKGEDIMNEVKARIVSDVNYDKALKGGLAVIKPEEAFASNIAERIPLFGRFFKASETAYTAFVYKLRMDIFNKYLTAAEKMGANIDDPVQLKAIAHVVNSLTGRGSLGRFEGAGDALNTVFFSPRNVKGHIDTLFQPLGAGGATTKFARQKAATNLAKVIVGTAAILKIADTIRPGSVDLDPRSSDFGKIKVGDTRFDVTGGMSSILTLASRILPTKNNGQWGQYTKSSTTGAVSKLNSGFGSQTGGDIIFNFLQNKLSPVGSVIKDLYNQKDSQGNKPTVLGEVKNSLPLSITNYQELRSDPKAANTLLAMIADGMGIATNTYNATGGKSPWETSTSKELQQFKQAVGDQKFKDAGKQYSDQLNTFMDSIKKNKDYNNLTPDQQQQVLTNEKSKIQRDIFSKNGFRYRTDRNASNQLKKFLQ